MTREQRRSINKCICCDHNSINHGNEPKSGKSPVTKIVIIADRFHKLIHPNESINRWIKHTDQEKDSKNRDDRDSTAEKRE